MKISAAPVIIRLAIAGFILVTFDCSVYSQSLTIEQIKNNLLNNPPNGGDAIIRKESILALDALLISDSARTSEDIFNLYTSMMEKVNNELRSGVDKGASVWMMYNHGYLVKTPDCVFAFDLVNGYTGWHAQLPLGLIDQVKVLFISHNHSDHVDTSIINRIIAKGGHVIYPAEIPGIGNIPMKANDSLFLDGLHIKSHPGLHGDVALRIYEVVTQNGLKFLHTGDNQTSATLPQVGNLDVLLLNAWVNESGAEPASIGMSNSVNKLNPEIMLPGHIQELAHDYDPGNPAGRIPYQAVYQISDSLVAEKTHVMIWGEVYTIAKEGCTVSYPRPRIKYGRKDSAGRVYIPVENWSVYSNEMFRRAPELPPCGMNRNASRTWVNIYNAYNNAYVYGFCALNSKEDLRKIWFMPYARRGRVYIRIIDRTCNTQYKSNIINWR